MFQSLLVKLFLLAAIVVPSANVCSQHHNSSTQKAISASSPYATKYIDSAGLKMAYIEGGKGSPILFLHGVPTSSYLWRNVMPHLEDSARVIAPDLIGFGKSDKAPRYFTFDDHYRHLVAFIESLSLSNITLVLHDWGSALGLHYAVHHPENVRAIVTMESIIAPNMPASSYDEMPRGSANFFKLMRSEKGQHAVIKHNFFIETILPGAIKRELSKDEMAYYRAPFTQVHDRKQLAWWPLQMPIGKEPQYMHKIVEDYNEWLANMTKPWLLLYASPGALNSEDIAEYWRKRAKNIEVKNIGKGSHFIQEDHPHVIGESILDWYVNSVLEKK